MEQDELSFTENKPPVSEIKNPDRRFLPLPLQAAAVMGIIYFMLLSILFIYSWVYYAGLYRYIHDFTSFGQLSMAQLRILLVPAVLLQLLIITGAALILCRMRTGIFIFSTGSFINLLLILIFFNFDWLNSAILIIFILLPLFYIRKIR